MKRVIAILLAAALLAPLSGCASVFDKEYLSVSQSAGASEDPAVSDDGAIEVRNFFGLRIAVTQLVSGHQESGTLNFRRYEGDINDDIAAACKDVSTNTALGAYCVDYISYDLDRIVAYYEAKIYIFYKRTAEETAAIVTLSTSDGLYAYVRAQMEDLQTDMVVLMNTAGLDKSDLLDCVDRVCREDPLCCINKPDAAVEEYDGGGAQKIFELKLDYGGTREALLAKRQELSDAVAELAGQVTSETAPYRALQAAGLVVSACASDETAGDTAYAALVQGSADSEGMAMAYAAVCAAADLPCQVVEGRLDKSEHYWNIVCLDGAYYHADLSRIMAEGYAASFLLGDSYMWGRYWWDTELYPACEGTLAVSALTAQQ